MDSTVKNKISQLAFVAESFINEFHKTHLKFKSLNSVDEKVLLLRYQELVDAVTSTQKVVYQSKLNDSEGQKEEPLKSYIDAQNEIKTPHADDSDCCGRGYDITRKQSTVREYGFSF